MRARRSAARRSEVVAASSWSGVVVGDSTLARAAAALARVPAASSAVRAWRARRALPPASCRRSSPVLVGAVESSASAVIGSGAAGGWVSSSAVN